MSPPLPTARPDSASETFHSVAKVARHIGVRKPIRSNITNCRRKHLFPQGWAKKMARFLDGPKEGLGLVRRWKKEIDLIQTGCQVFLN